jgi:hypothetical protein
VLAAYCDIFGVSGAALFQYQETVVPENTLVLRLEKRRRVFCSTDDNPALFAENRDLRARHRISFVMPLFESDLLAGFFALEELAVRDEQHRYEEYDRHQSELDRHTSTRASPKS